MVYLATLGKPALDKIYVQPATALSLLRLLPPLAKQIVFRLLYVQVSTKQSLVDNWVLPTQKRLLALTKQPRSSNQTLVQAACDWG
jgi:hypothetical protein